MTEDELIKFANTGVSPTRLAELRSILDNAQFNSTHLPLSEHLPIVSHAGKKEKQKNKGKKQRSGETDFAAGESEDSDDSQRRNRN